MKGKKLLSGLLAAAMVFSMAACGGGTDEDSQGGAGASAGGTETAGAGLVAGGDVADMPVVRAAFPGVYDTTDAPMVQEEINKILAERYGIQCELNFISMGSWSQQTNLLLTGDEVDVIAYFTLPLATYVTNGQCTDLTDYVANASEEFRSLFTEEQWKGCQVNGRQYAVPNLRNYGNVFQFVCDETIFNEMGFDAAKITTLDDVEEVLYAVHEAHPELYTIVPQTGALFVNGWTWDGLGDQNYIGVLGNCGQDTTVTDIFELEDFKEFCQYTHKWYTDGLMMGDALSNQDIGTTLVQNGGAFSYLSNAANGNPPKGTVACQIIDNWTESTNVSALTYGINALSSRKDAAWVLLEAMYTDIDVMKLLCNGIEGVHYVMNEDGTASYPDGVDATTSTYGNASSVWALPYAASGVPVMKDMGEASYFEDLKQFNNESQTSKAVGFVLDTDAMGITDEYSACLNVKDKYYNGLMNGVLDPDTVLAQAHQEMVDAGIEKVIAAKQEMLDELLGN